MSGKEFIPGDEPVYALRGGRAGYSVTSRDGIERVLVQAMAGALRELLTSRSTSKKQGFFGKEPLTSDLAFQTWVLTQHPMNWPRLVIMIRRFLPG